MCRIDTRTICRTQNGGLLWNTAVSRFIFVFGPRLQQGYHCFVIPANIYGCKELKNCSRWSCGRWRCNARRDFDRWYGDMSTSSMRMCIQRYPYAAMYYWQYPLVPLNRSYSPTCILNLLQPRSSMVDLDDKRVQAGGLQSWNLGFDAAFFCMKRFWTLSICIYLCVWSCASCDLAVNWLKCCIACLT